mgnify:CR=1 FL=1
MTILKITEQLDSIFSLSGFSAIALTGGGGKTSLLYSLGHYFAKREKVLLTTTTKLYPPQSGECACTIVASAEECAKKAAAMPSPSLSLAARRAEDGKLLGFSVAEADSLFENGCCGKFIVEADGTRGLSFKCYEGWEPPVPQSTACQIVILGADAAISPVSTETVFRMDMLKTRYGIQKGETISAANMGAILSNRAEYLKNSPKEAFRILFINKGELLEEEQRRLLLNSLWTNIKDYDGAAIGSMREDTVYDYITKERG